MASPVPRGSPAGPWRRGALTRGVALTLLLAGCQEYKLNWSKDDPDEPVETETETDPVGQTATESETQPTGPTDTGPVECERLELNLGQWWGSQPFTYEGDLVDSSGHAFHELDYTMLDYSTVSLPDRNITVGADKVYLTWFDLTAVPPALSLGVQSDDGLWLWVNGAFVGHWGGDWQQEGCVNDEAECLETISVPPVDITALAVVGTNKIAARVSNPVASAYFDVYPCAN